MSLEGIVSTSPIPRRARQFNPAAGSSVNAGGLRPVVLIGNKLSSGSEVVETLGAPIQSLSDCFNRFGQRSEIAWMYRKYTTVDVNALVSAIAVAEGSMATASTQAFSLENNATVATVICVDTCKGTLEVLVAVGDTPATQVANVAAAINADPDLPLSAAAAAPVSASGNAILLSTATAASPETYSGAGLTGSVGAGTMTPPQPITITSASHTGTYVLSAITITGKNPAGATITASLTPTMVNGGETLTTSISFASVTSVAFPAQNDTSGHWTVGVATAVDAAVVLTTYNKGPRSAGWLNQVRVSFEDPTNATTILAVGVAAGDVDDSVANAIAAAEAAEFTYHALACTATSSVADNDGGVGQYCTYIASSVAPAGNKSQMAIFAVDGTSSQATAVTQSSCVNLVEAHCYRVYTCDWPPSMVAAHHAAIHRSTEVNYAAQNLAGWTNNSTAGQVYQIPPPFNKDNWPGSVDETTDLNGGVSTVGFRTDGTPYIVRSITTYSWTGSSSTSDYRAREGHIPSVLFKFWEDLDALLIAGNQPNVAADPPAGGKRAQGFMYPSTVLSITRTLITAMTGPYQNRMALLDPSVLTQMLQQTSCTLGAAGWEVDPAIACVRHNLFDDALISEIGPAY